MPVSLINAEHKDRIVSLVAQSNRRHLFVYIGRCKIHDLPKDMQRFYSYLPDSASWQSPLHNPLNMDETGATREAACDYFDNHFNGLLQEPSSEGCRVFTQLVQEAKQGRSITLICHCAPERCHGMRVQEALQMHLQQNPCSDFFNNAPSASFSP